MYRIAGKFGGLAVYVTIAKLKSTKISYWHIYIWRSRQIYKSANILAIAILGSTTKFNSTNISSYTVYCIQITMSL